MAVLPATERVELGRVGSCLSARKVRMAAEEEIAFTAGTRRDIVRMRTKNYLESEAPTVCGREEILA